MSDDENHNFVPEDLSNYKVVREGNLVINKMKAWQGSLGIAPYDGVVSPAYFVFDFRIGDRSYGQALLRSKPYVALFARASDGVRIGQWDLSISGMKRIPVVVPPVAEQSAIVRFLDHADRIIRRYVRAKRRLVGLLNEQKQAIIHQAVTRGLDPNVRLKPSGIDWVGDVPEHWGVAPLKRIKALAPNSFVDGPFGSNLKSEHYVEGGDVYVVESGFVTSGQFVWKKFKTITREHFQTINRSSCEGGDIVIAKIGARYGMAAILPELDKPAVVSGNSLKLTINETRYDRRYIHLSLLCARFRGAFFHFANATAQPALSLRGLNNLSLPTPGIDEQRGIVQAVGEQTREVDLALHQTACEITLLREYRTRLIADVVTGKLDVRGVELPQSEEAEELPRVGDEIADNATEEGGELEPVEEVTHAAG
jgi:type I restriction enzyme S subunit